MKKYIVLFTAISSLTVWSQHGDYPQNEVKANFLNILIQASVELGYERFVDFNQSIEAELLFNDRVNYHSEKGARKFDTNSLKIGYVYYFGTENAGSGLYANPFFKYRWGDFTDEVTVEDVRVSRKIDMNGFIIGIGAGYKWNGNDKFVFGPYVNVGRNFNDDSNDRFTAIEFNAGFSFGYRF
ncbi:MAG: autotransporter outer membrane beta-barrel domain-containing protein [Flavobacterium sp.]